MIAWLAQHVVMDCWTRNVEASAQHACRHLQKQRKKCDGLLCIHTICYVYIPYTLCGTCRRYRRRLFLLLWIHVVYYIY